MVFVCPWCMYYVFIYLSIYFDIMFRDYPNDLRYSYTLSLDKCYVNQCFGLMYTYCLILRWDSFKQ